MQVHFLLLFPRVFESVVCICQLLQVVLEMKFNLKDIPWRLEYTDSDAELSVVLCILSICTVKKFKDVHMCM